MPGTAPSLLHNIISVLGSYSNINIGLFRPSRKTRDKELSKIHNFFEYLKPDNFISTIEKVSPFTAQPPPTASAGGPLWRQPRTGVTGPH